MGYPLIAYSASYITQEQIYSKVTIKFAVPVLNETRAIKFSRLLVLTTETSKKATYCQILDQVFDCLNVRSLENILKENQAISATEY